MIAQQEHLDLDRMYLNVTRQQKKSQFFLHTCIFVHVPLGRLLIANGVHSIVAGKTRKKVLGSFEWNLFSFANVKFLVLAIDHPPFSIAPYEIAPIHISKRIDLVLVRACRFDTRTLTGFTALLAGRTEFA